MSAFQRTPQRFLCKGLNLTRALDDPALIAAGKFPILLNVRSDQEGVLTPRLGVIDLNASFPMADPFPHSLGLFNNPTGFSSAQLRVIGASTKLYGGTTSTFPQIDSGYSGNPLTFLVGSPEGADQPFLYVADSVRLQKWMSDGIHHYAVGIVPPKVEPSVLVAVPNLSQIDSFESTSGWNGVAPASSAPVLVSRVSTQINVILYDQGSTGWALISPIAFTNIGPGTLLTLASTETVLVTEVKNAIASTTVGAILYDSGTSGLCTIQPVASLGTGQLDATDPAVLEARNASTTGANAFTAPASAPLTPTSPIRQADFPVDNLIQIGSGFTVEYVRVLSVCVGADGIQSFRCSTLFTHAAGESLIGVASFRSFLGTTRGPGDAIATQALEHTLTPTATGKAMVGGIYKTGLSINLAQIGTRPTLPDDDIHVTVRVSSLADVSEIRLVLNVDSVNVGAFTRNYYFAAFDQSALSQATPDVNAGPASTVTTAQQTGLQIRQIRQPGKGLSASQLSGGDGTDTTASFGIGTSESSGGTVAQPTVGSLGIGASQWLELRCKVRDLIRVGTDTSRSLADVNGLEILVSANGNNVLTVDYDALWIAGGYGPDVGDMGTPIVYAYRYRSTSTGAASNPSPSPQAGVIPRRQMVTITGVASADPQVDVVDWYRFGSGLPRWTYIGTTPNYSPPVFVDTLPDLTVLGGDPLASDHWQPWPTIGVSTNSTVNVVGNAIQWVAGNLFSTAWVPGTTVLVNGISTTLRCYPPSTTLLFVADNVGSATGITAKFPEPALTGQALPTLWGPFEGVYMACGDPNRPGWLQWSNPNDPDSTLDTCSLEVTPASEPLQNGFVYDGQPFVFSVEDLFLIVSALQLPSRFQAQKTACGKGVWTRWAFCTGPEGIYFLGKDGIYLTRGGSPAVSLTDADLYPLFPHEGVDGVTVNGFDPPDFTQTARLRLSYCDGWLFFDYANILGVSCVLSCRIADKSWWPDLYTPGIRVRYTEPGKGIHDQVFGCEDGVLYQPSNTGWSRRGAPAIPCHVLTPATDLGEPRSDKVFGDLIVDCDPAYASTILAQAQFDNQMVLGAATTIGSGLTGRGQFIVEIGTTLGLGQQARNIALDLSWSEILSPSFYLWEPSWVPKVESSKRRASDWDDAGTPGAKYVQGIILRADTANVTRSIQVWYDGTLVGATLAITHNGEKVIAYSFPTPFVAHLLKLVPQDASAWHLYDWKWVFEPAPELGTTWEAQSTSLDFPGFFILKDFLVAHQSTADLTLTLIVDGVSYAYTIPNSSGLYRRTYVTLGPLKGKSVQPIITSSVGCQIYKRDCVLRAQGWGVGGWQYLSVFGGQHRSDGAAI